MILVVMVEINLSRGSRDVFLDLDHSVQAEVAATLDRLSNDPCLTPTRSVKHLKYGRVHLICFSEACVLIYVVAEAILEKILMPPATTPTHIIGALCKPHLVEETLPLLE